MAHESQEEDQGIQKGAIVHTGPGRWQASRRLGPLTWARLRADRLSPKTQVWKELRADIEGGMLTGSELSAVARCKVYMSGVKEVMAHMGIRDVDAGSGSGSCTGEDIAPAAGRSRGIEDVDGDWGPPSVTECAGVS